jgi:hypothetical protein
MPDEVKTFMVEDAQLVFRNFSGKEGKYNTEGQRNFCVILDEKTAKQMLKDGWNVRALTSREEDEPDAPYIQVTVSFKNRPPRVVMITSAARTHLGEDDIAVLDWADIRTCDLIARAYEWEVNGKSGIKAYLQSMFVTIEEDALERKYAAIEDNG